MSIPTDKSVIPIFNNTYNNYLNISYKDTSLDTKIKETSYLVNTQYVYLVFWFLFTLFVIIITILIFLKQENSFILYSSLGILIFITFFIHKNIYLYFNVLS